MIDNVASSAVNQFQTDNRDFKLDRLTQKRMEEGRQMAIAATQAEHQAKIRMAVEKYMKWPNEVAPNTPVSLSQAQQAYGKF
jgi:hypothetical protein